MLLASPSSYTQFILLPKKTFIMLRKDKSIVEKENRKLLHQTGAAENSKELIQMLKDWIFFSSVFISHFNKWWIEHVWPFWDYGSCWEWKFSNSISFFFEKCWMIFEMENRWEWEGFKNLCRIPKNTFNREFSVKVRKASFFRHELFRKIFNFNSLNEPSESLNRGSQKLIKETCHFGCFF